MEQEERKNSHQEKKEQILRRKRTKIEKMVDEVTETQRKHFFLQISLNLLGENRKVVSELDEDILVLEKEKEGSICRFLKLDRKLGREEEEEDEEEGEEGEENLFEENKVEEKRIHENNEIVCEIEVSKPIELQLKQQQKKELVIPRGREQENNKRKATAKRQLVIDKLKESKKDNRRGESTLVRKTFFGCFKDKDVLKDGTMEKSWEWVENIRYICEESILWLTTTRKMRPSSLLNKYLLNEENNKAKPRKPDKDKLHYLLLQKGLRLLSDSQIEQALQQYIPNYRHEGFRNLSIIEQLFRNEINLSEQGYLFRDFNMQQFRYEYNFYTQNIKHNQFNYFIINNAAIQNNNNNNNGNLNLENLNLNLSLQRVPPTEVNYNSSTSEIRCYNFEPNHIHDIRHLIEQSRLQRREFDRKNVEKLLLFMYSKNNLHLKTLYFSMLHSGQFTLDDISTIVQVIKQFPEVLQLVS